MKKQSPPEINLALPADVDLSNTVEVEASPITIIDVMRAIIEEKKWSSGHDCYPYARPAQLERLLQIPADALRSKKMTGRCDYRHPSFEVAIYELPSFLADEGIPYEIPAETAAWARAIFAKAEVLNRHARELGDVNSAVQLAARASILADNDRLTRMAAATARDEAKAKEDARILKLQATPKGRRQLEEQRAFRAGLEERFALEEREAAEERERKAEVARQGSLRWARMCDESNRREDSRLTSAVAKDVAAAK